MKFHGSSRVRIVNGSRQIMIAARVSRKKGRSRARRGRKTTRR